MTISGGATLVYRYNGAGAKLRMENSNGAVNTKYAGAFEYDKNNYLTRIATEEGQIGITNNGATNNDYSFEYYLKDHLGNTRMVMNEAGTMIQETEYFPFGLAIPKISGTNKYTFLGKERQAETNWIDLQARFYDPTIGRFMTVDPETDGQLEFSPYHYSFNNPIRFSDPDGRWPGEGLFKSIKNWLNTPLTKEQQDLSRGLNISFSGQDYKSQTRGDALLTSIGQGIRHGMSHGLPGNSKTSGLSRKAMAGPAAKSAKTTNSVPETVARVIPEDAMKYAQSLGRPGVEDVFVTAASDLKGIKTSEGIAKRLTLQNPDGSAVKGPFRILEFNTPSQGIASPVRRNDPGFIGGGRTAGGAAEFVLPNLRFDEIEIKNQRVVE